MATVKENKRKRKNPGGRPTTRVMPDPIPDTLESVARACMQGPSKKEWDYLKKKGAALRRRKVLVP